MTCRFWAGSTRTASTFALDAAIPAVLARLAAEDVPAPPPVHRVIIAADAEGAKHEANCTTDGADAAP